MAKFFVYPFAVNGDMLAIPDPTQVSGSVSYQSGWPGDYQLPYPSNPASLPISRSQTNQLMFDITDAINQYQTHGFPDWISAADNLGTSFAYDIYSVVRYNAGSGVQVYQSLTQGNTTTPGGDPSWGIISTNVINDNVAIGTDFGINPWQVGTSIVSPANGTKLADMFKWSNSGSGTVTVSKSTNVPSVAVAGTVTTASMSALVTGANASPGSTDYSAFRYVIEGYDFCGIAQNPFTLSFRVYASTTGTYTVGLSNSNGDRAYAATFTVVASNTWQNVSISIPASPSGGTWNYVNGIGLDIEFVQCAGSGKLIAPNSWVSGGSSNQIAATGQVNNMATNGNIFAIDLLKIEQGLSQTVFQAASVQETLSACQRYYEKSYSQGTNPGTASAPGHRETAIQAASTGGIIIMTDVFKVEKCIVPTMTYYSIAGNAGFATEDNGTEVPTTLETTSTSSANVQISNTTIRYSNSHHFTADAAL